VFAPATGSASLECTHSLHAFIIDFTT
jgi:hypothetical protein